MHEKTDCSFSVVGIFLLLLFCCFSGPAQSDYSVLGGWRYYTDAENSIYKDQVDLALQSLAKRKEAISRLRTQSDWTARQQLVREKLHKSAGPFPEKTPLRPVITERIENEGYSIEKLYFESIPGVKVTAAFFIPKGKNKILPTIIYCSGHAPEAFRNETYQHVILNLVKKGFAVFAYDPFGQGERKECFNTKKCESKYGQAPIHSHPGAQLFINGASAAKYMIWDGIRAVDYLHTRKEVDQNRIGITGRSGGGTQSVYIAAFDERIKAAAPECFLTTMEYQLKTNGPQDAEQNFPNGISLGLDHADFLEVRAPKPTLMITTTRDIFSIQGSRDTYREVRQAYKAFGREDNIHIIEDDAGHESTLKNREAMYAFFQKHLKNTGDSQDEEVSIFPEEELYVTETGQLATSIQSKLLFDINLSLTQKNRIVLHEKRQDMMSHLKSLKKKVTKISGFDQDGNTGKLIFSGRTDFERYSLEKYLIVQAENKILPFLTFVPKQCSGFAVLYLDDIKDKNSAESHSIPIRLAKKGMTVIVPDLPGFGALGPGYKKAEPPYSEWFAGVLNGKSMVALHAEAISTLLTLSSEALKLKDKKIIGISKGSFNSSLLHASILGINFDGMALIKPMPTFDSLSSDKEYNAKFIPFTVAGSLPHYDLPDLAASFAPRKLMLYYERDTIAGQADMRINTSYNFVAKHFDLLGKAPNFSIIKGSTEKQLMHLIVNFQSIFKE